MLGQFEIGIGAIPGGAQHRTWLAWSDRGERWRSGRSEDFDGDLAERYGYVNRAIPDDEFDNFIDRFARRVAAFDRQASMDIKQFVNEFTCSDDEEFPHRWTHYGSGMRAPRTAGRNQQALRALAATFRGRG